MSDSFFAEPFMMKFPGWVREDSLDKPNQFRVMIEAVNDGRFTISTDQTAFKKVLENLKETDPEFREYLRSKFDAAKITITTSSRQTPDHLKISGIRKSVLKHLRPAIEDKIQTACYDKLQDEDWKKRLSEALNKPLFLEQDFREDKIRFLFKEDSIPLKIDQEFDIINLLSKLSLPFKKIRILDPYFFKNLKNIHLDSILKVLTNKSKNYTIEIISTAPNQWKSVIEKFNELKLEKCTIYLYEQKSDISNRFHKRVLWTDFWTLFSDRGFDFFTLKSNFKSKVTKENTFILTGKYASGNSIWHQINNWDDYLQDAELHQKIKKE